MMITLGITFDGSNKVPHYLLVISGDLAVGARDSSQPVLVSFAASTCLKLDVGASRFGFKVHSTA